MYRYIPHLLISISLFSYNTAHAEDVSTDKDNLISGSIGLEYGTFLDDLSLDDTDTVTLSSNFEISLTPKLKLGTDFRKTEFLDLSGAPNSTLSSFNLGYAFSDKAIIRAFHTNENFFVIGLETYGISTSYTGKKYSISGYVAKADFFQSQSLDVNGISASYNLSENFTVSAGIDRMDVGYGEDLTRSTIGGSYTFGKGKSIYITANENKFSPYPSGTNIEHLKIGLTMDFGKTGIQPFKSPDFMGMLLSSMSPDLS